MYTGSLAEIFSYAGENPLGFWQPTQVGVRGPAWGTWGIPCWAEAPGSRGAEAELVDILASL